MGSFLSELIHPTRVVRAHTAPGETTKMPLVCARPAVTLDGVWYDMIMSELWRDSKQSRLSRIQLTAPIPNSLADISSLGKLLGREKN